MTKEQKAFLGNLPEEWKGIAPLAEQTWNFEDTFDKATKMMGLNDNSGIEDLLARVLGTLVGQNPAKDIFLKGLKREKTIEKKYKER